MPFYENTLSFKSFVLELLSSAWDSNIGAALKSN